MVGIDAPVTVRRSLTIAGALGRGFLTALATGPFAMLLVAVFLIAADPGEIANEPLETIGALASLLTVGSIFAIVMAVIIGWLPISLIGWLTANVADRWPDFRHPAIWAVIGIVTGGLCLVLINGSVNDLFRGDHPARWNRLREMAVFGGSCGLFAALLFRRLTVRSAP